MKGTHKSLIITKDEEDYIFSTGFVILRSKNINELLPEYLYYYVNTIEFLLIRDKIKIKG